MEMLNHRQFYDMLMSGAHEIIHHQKELNDINVFPVADGDTGNNLAYLMETIIRETRWTDPSVKTLEDVKQACMRGSRGNSGMIFSQFIISMCNYLIRHDEVAATPFLDMCDASVDSAVGAVSDPKEGTVLTVMQAWVSSMKEEHHHTSNIEHLLQKSYAITEAAMEKTKTQMEVFRINDVVDAGAKGFVHFLDGLIKRQEVPERKEGEAPALFVDETVHAMKETDEIPFRYCSEYLVELNPHESIDTLRQSMSEYGDSIVLVSDNQLGKVHIHTNDPADIADMLVQKGKVVYQKVEDMRRQYESIYRRKSPIAFVVDSACDLPKELFDHHQIHMIPLNLEVESSNYLDKVTLDAERFYEILDAGTTQPKSSQPSLLSVETLYKSLLQQYDSVISLHVSQKLSGTFDVCKKAAEQVDPSRIHVVNSRTLSGAFGLLAYETAADIEAGKSFEEVKEALYQRIARSEILVSVKNLKHMIRGGRVSPLQGKVARLLNMKPIVSVDGDGNSLLYGKTFFSSSSVGKMFKQVEAIHSRHGVKSYVLLNAGAPEAMADCEANMKRITGQEPLYTTSVSPVIGGNAGKGAISVAMMLNEDNARGGA
ncbi:DegV family protein [Salisediminibacterium selenitireducens]|uniref:DegV family protein n=1 Tax=Bacillus selenitireducens (strain ATCC 700615 / DSM 15326 / MLS10) TaxID=439292 RepID=D6XXQ9_BACIE|nr:DegV family protein [Salisediminibacterium selenitireducens]ADI00102.1 degV family protein [[Bacillus] selenitireducens MLS10]